MQTTQINFGVRTCAPVRCCQVRDRKPRSFKTKEERKTMVEHFIKKYQSSNNGAFPSLNATHKEVGGSFYTIREFFREIIQENKILGPGSLSSKVMMLENYLEEDEDKSFSYDPLRDDSSISILGTEMDQRQKDLIEEYEMHSNQMDGEVLRSNDSDKVLPSNPSDITISETTDDKPVDPLVQNFSSSSFVDVTSAEKFSGENHHSSTVHEQMLSQDTSPTVEDPEVLEFASAVSFGHFESAYSPSCEAVASDGDAMNRYNDAAKESSSCGCSASRNDINVSASETQVSKRRSVDNLSDPSPDQFTYTAVEVFPLPSTSRNCIMTNMSSETKDMGSKEFLINSNDLQIESEPVENDSKSLKKIFPNNEDAMMLHPTPVLAAPASKTPRNEESGHCQLIEEHVAAKVRNSICVSSDKVLEESGTAGINNPLWNVFNAFFSAVIKFWTV